MVFAKKKVPGFVKGKTKEEVEEEETVNNEAEEEVKESNQKQGLTRDEVKDIIIGNLIRVIELVKLL